MIRKISIFAPVLAIAACAEETPTEAPAEVPGNELAGTEPTAPAPTPEPDSGDGIDGNRAQPEGEPMAWNFATTAAGPKLTYGEPRTDNVRLMLRCAGGDRIAFSFMRSSAGEGPMTVRSGGVSETAPATAEQTQLGGVSVRAELSSGAAPLQRFRGGSSLTVEYAGETRTVPPAGPEADRFFEAC